MRAQRPALGESVRGGSGSAADTWEAGPADFDRHAVEAKWHVIAIGLYLLAARRLRAMGDACVWGGAGLMLIFSAPPLGWGAAEVGARISGVVPWLDRNAFLADPRPHGLAIVVAAIGLAIGLVFGFPWAKSRRRT